MHSLLIAFTFDVVLAETTQAQSVMCHGGNVLTGRNAWAMCAAHGSLPSSPPGLHAKHCVAQHAAVRRNPRGRSWPGLGEQEQQGLPLSRRPLVRQNQAGRVHD